ncbi:unnamed protein product [Closterium sp. NIES-53]
MQAATLLSSVVAGAQDVGTGTSTPRPLAPCYRLDQLHLRCCRLRCLHPNCHRHRRLHLHRRHRSPHLCHHPHPLLRLHRHYLLPRHLPQHPCPACPCRCGASCKEQTQR